MDDHPPHPAPLLQPDSPTGTVLGRTRSRSILRRRVPRACLYIAPLLCGLLSACAPETVSRHYDTYALLEQDRAIDRGWLPEWLPRQATAIDEMHNIDTNAHMWAATVPVGIELNLPATCASAPRAKLTKLPFEPSWWPEPSVWPAGSEGAGFIYFTCDGEHVGLAQEGGRLFGWGADEGRR
jgi:hypothetical protein